ncbi:MAG TPA: hypothetical protein VKO61_01270, partial [Candidatus Paceibacterota bacterium]|nr:hypothetical protein [Candidatus Paceibacterota bacterium]
MGKPVGLPKVDKKKRKRKKRHKKRGKHKKKHNNNKTKSKKQPKLILLNSTRVEKVKDYFKTIHKDLFYQLAKKTNYQLYMRMGKEKPVFLVNQKMHHLASSLRKKVDIKHFAISIGFFKARRTRAGYDENFYLSYEGGRFLYNFMKRKAQETLREVHKVLLDNQGEKAFLYGRNISLDHVKSKTEHLVKRKIIFVLNQRKEYLGIALLKVKLIGSDELEERGRYIRKHSNSDNFILSLLN